MGECSLLENVSEDPPFADSRMNIADEHRENIRSFQQHQHLFYSCEIESIWLLCKYFPLEQLDDRAKLLSRRLVPELKAILRDTPPKTDENPAFRTEDSESLRIAKEIVWRIDGDRPALSLGNTEWILPWSGSNITADEAAKANIDKLTSRLRIIPFTEFGRRFCGYPSELVRDLLRDILELQHKLDGRLCAAAAARSEIERMNEVVSIMIQLTMTRY